MAEKQPLLAGQMSAPQFLSVSANGGRPQCIAHRGYRAKDPENTMAAFKSAIDVGAHAIETDLHLSRDGIVVISHDADLKRVFGRPEKIIDCDWEYLSTLRTLKEPHEPMPRLKDLLEYLTTPGLEDIWTLLDIKVPWPALLEPWKKDRIDEWKKLDNRADDIMRLIASTLLEVAPSKPWNQRIVLGCWAAKYLPLCTKYLPGYPITHIGFSISYARQFLKVPGISFNMLQKTMVGPCGSAFLRDIKKANRPIFLWTVDDEVWMRWSIKKEVNGVITDDPKKFLQVLDQYEDKKLHVPLKAYGSLIWMNLLAAVFSLVFRYKYGFRIDVGKIKKSFDDPAKPPK